MLDVSIQRQLGNIEDIAIADLNPREKVVFGSSSLSGVAFSRVVGYIV
jgi:hypothetical protein